MEFHQFSGSKNGGAIYLALHVLGIVLPVYITRRGLILYTERCVPNLGRQAVL